MRKDISLLTFCLFVALSLCLCFSIPNDDEILTKWHLNKILCWQNDELTKWQLNKIDKLVKWQNDYLTKWQVEKWYVGIKSWQNDKLTKWYVGKVSRQICKLTKCHADKMTKCLFTLFSGTWATTRSLFFLPMCSATWPGVNPIQLLSSPSTLNQNKLERLSFASIFSLFKYSWIWLVITLVECLDTLPQALYLPQNIRLCCYYKTL